MALTAKQEQFAQAVGIRGVTQVDAYSVIYDVSKMAAKTIENNAYRTASTPEVRARIEVLKERAVTAAVKKAGLTLADSMAEAGELLADAKAMGQISAGVAAATLRAKLAGHLVEKKAEDKNALDAMDVDKLLLVKQEVEARLQRAKDALDMCGDPSLATASAPVKLRRVIG